jgi:hypothetical protein
VNKLAEVTQEDIERAKDAWKKDAPPPYKELLDATPVEDASIPLE